VRSFTDKKILVADDSTTMRMFLLFHLIKMLPGVRIVDAVNGADALEKFKQHPDVDLVLTDMNMPHLDGAGLISAVRNELKNNVPIIIITTKGEEADRERGLALGANGYITKPLDVLEFRKTVFRFLTGA
jgi:two-component system chemotaxis response regulator CheY